MAELTDAPDGAATSTCCSPGQQTDCCEPAEKSDCCAPESSKCGCSAGASQDKEIRDLL
jgi:hypothetical protein